MRGKRPQGKKSDRQSSASVKKRISGEKTKILKAGASRRQGGGQGNALLLISNGGGSRGKGRFKGILRGIERSLKEKWVEHITEYEQPDAANIETDEGKLGLAVRGKVCKEE